MNRWDVALVYVFLVSTGISLGFAWLAMDAGVTLAVVPWAFLAVGCFAFAEWIWTDER